MKSALGKPIMVKTGIIFVSVLVICAMFACAPVAFASDKIPFYVGNDSGITMYKGTEDLVAEDIKIVFDVHTLPVVKDDATDSSAGTVTTRYSIYNSSSHDVVAKFYISKREPLEYEAAEEQESVVMRDDEEMSWKLKYAVNSDDGVSIVDEYVSEAAFSVREYSLSLPAGERTVIETVEPLYPSISGKTSPSTYSFKHYIMDLARSENCVTEFVIETEYFTTGDVDLIKEDYGYRVAYYGNTGRSFGFSLCASEQPRQYYNIGPIIVILIIIVMIPVTIIFLILGIAFIISFIVAMASLPFLVIIGIVVLIKRIRRNRRNKDKNEIDIL